MTLFSQVKSSITLKLLSAFLIVVLLTLLALSFALSALANTKSAQKKLTEHTLPLLRESQNLSQSIYQHLVLVEQISVSKESPERLKKKIQSSKLRIKDLFLKVKLLSHNKININGVEPVLDELFASSERLENVVLEQNPYLIEHLEIAKDNISEALHKIRGQIQYLKIKSNPSNEVSKKILLNIQDNLTLIDTSLGEYNQQSATINLKWLQSRYTSALEKITHQLLQLEESKTRESIALYTNLLFQHAIEKEGFFFYATMLRSNEQLVSKITKIGRERELEINTLLRKLTEKTAQATDQEIARFNTNITHSIRFMLILMLVVFIVSLAYLLLYIIPQVTLRIHRLTSVTQAVAAKQYDVLIDTSGHDELSYMAKALNSFRESLIAKEKADQLIQDRETRLSNIVDNAIDGLITINSKGYIESFNMACEKIFGYEAQEIIGENIRLLMPSPHQANHDSYLSNYAKTGIKKIIGKSHEVEGKRKDGTVFPMSLAVTELHIDGQSLFSGIVRDISDRKHKEMLLEESEAKFRAMYMNSPDAHLIMGMEDGRISDCNPAAQKMLKASKSQILSLTPDQLSPLYQPGGQLSSELAKVRIEETFAKGINRFNWTHRRVTGESFPCDVNASVIDYEERKVFLVVWRDMTEREELIKELSHAYLFNSTILNSTKHLLVSTDLNGVITRFNKAAEDALGYQEKELVGKESPALWHDQEEVIKRAQELSEKLKKNIKPGFEVFIKMAQVNKTETREWSFIAKDGSRFPVSLTVSCLYNNENEIVGYLGVAENITEQKKSQKEREQLISELTNSNEELERFAFACSHDLQEPLRMIRSFSEKLQEEMGDTLQNDEKKKKYFHFIVDGAKRAQELIHDILAYSRIDCETQKLEVVNLQKLIEAIEHNLQINLDESNGSLIFSSLPKVKGNKTQFFQLFQNLINNALKYQKDNSHPRIEIKVKDEGKFWLFSISDNGIGMDNRYLTKIFEVFQRLHKKSQYTGTGVGLSICKKVVERHGGNIWAESEVGVGSTFYFTILKMN